MIKALTTEMQRAECYKRAKIELIAIGAMDAGSGVDYRRYLNSSKAVYSELAYLAKLDRMQDSMMLRKRSKRNDRLVRLYWALKRMGR